MNIRKNELTNDRIVRKIMELLKEQRKTERDLERYVGLSNGTFTRWKYKNVKIYVKHLDKIAEFLEVPLQFLKCEVDTVMESFDISPEELQLIKIYRRIGKDMQDVLLKSAIYFGKLADIEKEKNM